jgi:hypothetical protein
MTDSIRKSWSEPRMETIAISELEQMASTNLPEDINGYG